MRGTRSSSSTLQKNSRSFWGNFVFKRNSATFPLQQLEITWQLWACAVTAVSTCCDSYEHRLWLHEVTGILSPDRPTSLYVLTQALALSIQATVLTVHQTRRPAVSIIFRGDGAVGVPLVGDVPSAWPWAVITSVLEHSTPVTLSNLRYKYLQLKFTF